MDALSQKQLFNLLDWFQKNKRNTPWRQSCSAYSTWISEVMLQQTTTQAVIPFFENFLRKFPSLESLAQAELQEVLEAWSGLGYYTRAKNLHKSAQMIHKNKGFPKTWEELIELPGFGPYTSRSVSSLAFGQIVGVVDGNVIRVFSRLFDIKSPWWNSSGKKLYQSLADQAAQASKDPKNCNQALMELGATVCTPQSPSCHLCPLSKDCGALKEGLQDKRPIAKAKPIVQNFIWEPEFFINKDQKIALVSGDYLPCLKKDLIFPGKITASDKPKAFNFMHTITKYKIFVIIKKESIHKNTKESTNFKNITWVNLKEIKKCNPSSLITKSLQQLQSFL